MKVTQLEGLRLFVVKMKVTQIEELSILVLKLGTAPFQKVSFFLKMKTSQIEEWSFFFCPRLEIIVLKDTLFMLKMKVA